MKLSTRDANQFFRTPRTDMAGVLLYGPDPMRTAIKRKDLVSALIGPDGDAEMRFTRIPAGDLRKDPGALTDALKAQGFFPGQRVVLVEDAADAVTKSASAALEDWTQGDAFLIVTAGALAARSSLRKLFESAASAYATAIYADPPGRDEVEGLLRAAGLVEVSPDGMRDILALSQSADPGDFRQTIEKLSLYKIGDSSPVTSDDVASIIPSTQDTAIDDVVGYVADGAVDRLGDALARLAGQGTQPTTICIQLGRYFRQLHMAATHPQGPEQALSRARPPVFGPRRDRMVRQARHWGGAKLEMVLGLILDADLACRSTQPVPQQALVERLMIRIAMTHSR